MKLFRTIAVLNFAAVLQAQSLNPVKWELRPETQKVAPGSVVIFHLKATIDEGWHLYSLTTPKGGAPATKITIAENPAVTFVRFHQPKPEVRMDPNFGVNTESYEHQTEFLIEANVAADAVAGTLALTAPLRYSVCSEKQCLPQRRSVVTELTIDPKAPKTSAIAVPAGYQLVDPKAAVPVAPAIVKPAPQALAPFW